MIRILDCKGVPVVCLKDEGRLGFVGEALYDGENNVKGFLLAVSYTHLTLPTIA